MNIDVPTDKAWLFRSLIEPRLVILLVGGIVRTMWGQVDVSNGNLTSPSLMDNELPEICGPPGRALFPVSAPCHFTRAPTCL